MKDLKEGQTVYAFTDNKENITEACIETGITTGSSFPCALAGCSGRRISVKWEDRKITYPCSKDMFYRSTSFYSTSIRIDADSWLIGTHPLLDVVEFNIDITPEHQKELHRVTPKEPFRSKDSDGDRPMQMPCNWSVDDVVECMITNMDMSFTEVYELVQDRDLMYEILSQFQENLASHDWTMDMEDSIKQSLE